HFPRTHQRASKEGSMSRLIGAVCAIALAAFPRAAQAQVIPLADCVTQGSDPSSLQAWFGYRNTDPAAVVIPIGLDNFFQPPPADRGQPVSFDPGEFHRVFFIGFPATGSVTWTLA